MTVLSNVVISSCCTAPTNGTVINVVDGKDISPYFYTVVSSSVSGSCVVTVKARYYFYPGDQVLYRRPENGCAYTTK